MTFPLPMLASLLSQVLLSSKTAWCAIHALCSFHYSLCCYHYLGESLCSIAWRRNIRLFIATLDILDPGHCERSYRFYQGINRS